MLCTVLFGREGGRGDNNREKATRREEEGKLLATSAWMVVEGDVREGEREV